MIMENKVAIITQSYKNDFRECKLLCESIDKFAPNLDHYIFVNDEDIEMFMCLQYGKHVVLKKFLGTSLVLNSCSLENDGASFPC